LLPNPLSLAAGQVGKVALTAVDHVAVRRFGDAEQLFERALSADPKGSPDRLAAAIVKRIARELGAAGAVTGAVAAAPGVGTTASLASGAADIGVSFGRLATMVLAVGLAYGHDLADEEDRRQHVYAVLSGTGSHLTEGERRAGDLKKQLGKQALGKGKDGPMGNVLTSKIGTKVVSKLVAREMAVKAATLLPLGIGTGVGAVGNRAMAFSVGRTAIRYFDPNKGSGSASNRVSPDLFIPAGPEPGFVPRNSQGNGQGSVPGSAQGNSGPTALDRLKRAQRHLNRGR
jgi:hypothetical protein